MIEFVRPQAGVAYTCLWRQQCDAPVVVLLVEDDNTWCGQASCANEAHLAEAIELHEQRKADKWAWLTYYGRTVVA